MRRIAIVICSDRCYKGESVDKTGPALRSFFEDHPRVINSNPESTGHSQIVAPSVVVRVVPDEQSEIQAAVKKYCDEQQVHLLVTSGGTGFSQRDVTPEAVKPLLHKEAPGIVHAMMAFSLEKTKFAWLSRPVAGVRHNTIIISVPGSPKAAVECLTPLIENGLEHAMELASGNQRDAHPTPAPTLLVKEGEGGGRISPTAASFTSSGNAVACGTPTNSLTQKRRSKNAQELAQATVKATKGANRARESHYEMTPMPQALELISTHCTKPTVIERSTMRAKNVLGHILAHDVVSPHPHPPFRASIMDGYALRSTYTLPGTFQVQGGYLAGDTDVSTLPEGLIARVNTGGPVPDGADAVIKVEETQLETTDEATGQELTVTVKKAVPSGNDIRPVGCDIKSGDIVMKAGLEIGAAEVGLAHTVGATSMQVFRRPIVAVLSTGDELADLQQCENGQLPPGKIFDSNKGMLLAALQSMGYETLDVGIARDEFDDTLTKVKIAMSRADVIISSGGVSMGEVDFVKEILLEIGATIHFGRVNMKPGKPTTFATRQGVNGGASHMFFGLPGNPVSAMVCLYLFVLPALKQFEGKDPKPKTVRAVVEHSVRLDAYRPEYHRCVLKFDHTKGYFTARTTGNQASHNLQSMSTSNGLMVLPVATAEAGPALAENSAVEVILIGPIEN